MHAYTKRNEVTFFYRALLLASVVAGALTRAARHCRRRVSCRPPQHDAACPLQRQMPAMLKDKAEWDQALADAGDKLVVVDFTASWSVLPALSCGGG